MFVFLLNRILVGISLITLVITLTACGSDGQASEKPVESGVVGIDNNQPVLRAAYLDIRTPDGFYSETFRDSDVYYSISHVKNIEILPLEERSGVARYELGSDDFTDALIWSEQAAAYQPVYKQLVDNSETNLYFEFTRVDLNNPQFVHLSRVFKMSALDRSGVDLDEPEGYQGRITLAILTANRVKMIMEYFWTFSFSNNTGNVVLESYTTEYETTYIHTMVEAKLNVKPSTQCDTIETFVTIYIVQKDTGDIFKYREMTGEILSKRFGDEFVICDSSTFN